MKTDTLRIGDPVEVTRKPNNDFDHDFVGVVTGYHDKYITVTDQDDDAWDCDYDQLNLASNGANI